MTLKNRWLYDEEFVDDKVVQVFVEGEFSEFN
jgi:hypothetical protein